MNQQKMFTYSPDLALSYKYLKVIILCLEPKIFNEKVEVSFVFMILHNKNSTFSFNILGSRHSMMTSKHLFDRIIYNKIKAF